MGTRGPAKKGGRKRGRRGEKRGEKGEKRKKKPGGGRGFGFGFRFGFEGVQVYTDPPNLAPFRVFLNLWFGKPIVCVRVAFHENGGNPRT